MGPFLLKLTFCRFWGKSAGTQGGVVGSAKPVCRTWHLETKGWRRFNGQPLTPARRTDLNSWTCRLTWLTLIENVLKAPALSFDTHTHNRQCPGLSFKESSHVRKCVWILPRQLRTKQQSSKKETNKQQKRFGAAQYYNCQDEKNWFKTILISPRLQLHEFLFETVLLVAGKTSVSRY